MKPIPLFFLILILLSACSPSTQAAETEPTALPTFDQPKIVLHTKTPTPDAASTATPTPTLVTISTPLPDVKLIAADPETLLLEVSDLPLAGNYYLPNAGLSPLRNSEIIQSLGVEKGEEYINATGRIDGWIGVYERGTKTVSLPDEVIDTVVIYETLEGAQLSIEKYWHLNRSPKIRKILSPPAVGDLSLALSLVKGNRVEYAYFFSFRNVVHILEIKGLESEVTLDLVEQLANKLLAKLVSVQFQE